MSSISLALKTRQESVWKDGLPPMYRFFERTTPTVGIHNAGSLLPAQWH